MSQRIHSCLNNTNLDTIHCDSYASRLNSKTDPKNRGVTKTLARSRDTQTTRGSTTPGGRSVTTRQSIQQNGKADPIIRKDVYADNAALVEVTVKTHNNRQRSRSNSQIRSNNKDTWGKILKAQSSNENISSFNNFDPLRTIHFLARELQCKLQQSIPHDAGVQNMVVEMQQALSRVPPDVPSSIVAPSFSRGELCDKIDIMKSLTMTKDSYMNTVPIPGPIYMDTETQTPEHLFVEPAKLQQHLEESSEKIEKACKQMETLCAKLKCEKDELEVLLSCERDVIKNLNKQLEEQRTKNHTSKEIITSLQSTNQHLETEVRRLNKQLECSQNPDSKELRALIEDLQKQKFEAEEECMLLKQQLTITNMEVEKYEAILQARDSQVKEIRNEMSQLQEVVNEQLMELQNNPYSSDVSTFSNTTGSSWHSGHVKSSNKPIRNQNFTLSSANSTAEGRPVNKESGDSSESDGSKQETVRNKKHKEKSKPIQQIKSSVSNLPYSFYDKFAEIKKQALMCKPKNVENLND